MAVSDPFVVRAVDHVRRYAQDTLDGVRWPPDKIAELLDTANAIVHNLIVSNVESKSYNQFCEATISLVNGTRDYSWPGNFRKFVRLVRKNSSGEIIGEILPADYLADTSGIFLFSKDRGFRINPVPLVTEDWVLVYEPSALPYLCFGRLDTGAHSTTSIILKSPDSTYVSDFSTGELGGLGLSNDFYNSSYVRVTDKSDGSFATARVADWVGSTKTATLASALPFTPASGDLYEFLPCLTHPYDKSIMWRAVMMMKSADADLRHRKLAEDEFKAILQEALVEASDVQGRLGPSMGSGFLDTFDYGGRGDRGDFGYFGIGVGLSL